MTHTLIKAEFLRNARGDAFIKFFDPAYVRADLVFLDRPSKTLFAVLHEQEHCIGRIDDEMFDAFCAKDEVHLTSILSSGKAVNLRAPLAKSE